MAAHSRAQHTRTRPSGVASCTPRHAHAQPQGNGGEGAWQGVGRNGMQATKRRQPSIKLQPHRPPHPFVQNLSIGSALAQVIALRGNRAQTPFQPPSDIGPCSHTQPPPPPPQWIVRSGQPLPPCPPPLLPPHPHPPTNSPLKPLLTQRAAPRVHLCHPSHTHWHTHSHPHITTHTQSHPHITTHTHT